ncbi:hypothetical protein PC129_g15982 [Phytophthora cactorum]|uniref:Uncharacterized protein n=1 Tax=Phytophthora cactorum TaxID=29920 RepID=A0A8T0YDR8_9STRA|nr:hypothetical protein Pcac1_g20999 [Phytophthora cactorum]KAG2812900.1 hypothetical protein PC111_g14614 [Phytophthora cactorum]KAG2850606.1 hypothetical protein PC113_g16635 [Phytophthora cactorum]KAG2886893.1 hypothetical protein PC114_g19059 [Phytophthora cactorum]KAG2898247.1 hypothetical protein PC115_g16897 [Phytophthora cactorum]
MGGKGNRKSLRKIAGENCAGPLRDLAYENVEVTEPMQTDSDNRGWIFL